MEKTGAPTKPKQPLTPLWVISLFISLTETVLGLAVTKTTGTVQVMLTVFVIVFPVMIAAAFFVLLWFRPHHLYAPSDYSNVTGVREYVEAVTMTKLVLRDTSADTLVRFWKPNGTVNRSNQTKLRHWLKAHNLGDIPLTVFITGEVFQAARQNAAHDLNCGNE